MKFDIENGLLKGYEGQDEIVVIPEEVHTIGEKVFKDHNEIREVRFPAGLKKICEYAFAYCASLEEIILPEGLVEIGDSAFYFDTIHDDCKLRRISIPASLQTVESMFTITSSYSIEKLEIADLNTWLKLDQLYFWQVSLEDFTVLIDGKPVEELIIPEGITVIKEHAFHSFRQLRKVTLPNTVKRIEEGAFTDCKMLEEINIPDSVEYIGQYAFSRCLNLKALSFPSSVTDIGEGICNMCKGLKSVTISKSVKSLNRTFEDCEQLETVQLSEGLQEICSRTFGHCESLKAINIPESVEHISTEAFVNCTTLTSVTYPGKIKSIRPDAFRNCKKLKEIRINPKEKRAAIGYFGASKKILDLDGNPLNEKSQVKKQSTGSKTSKENAANDELLKTVETQITQRQLNSWAVKNKLAHASLERVKSLETGKNVPKEIPLFIMYAYMSQMKKIPAYNKDTFRTMVLNVQLSEAADQLAAKLEPKSLMKALLDAYPSIAIDAVYDYNWKKEFPMKLNQEFRERMKDYEDDSLMMKSEVDDTIARALPYGRYADGDSIKYMIRTMENLSKYWEKAGKQAAIVIRSAICLNDTDEARKYCDKTGILSAYNQIHKEEQDAETQREETQSAFAITEIENVQVCQFNITQYQIAKKGITYSVVFDGAGGLNNTIQDHLTKRNSRKRNHFLYDAQDLRNANESFFSEDHPYNTPIPKLDNPLSPELIEEKTVKFAEDISRCLSTKAISTIIDYMPQKKNGALDGYADIIILKDPICDAKGWSVALRAISRSPYSVNLSLISIYLGDRKYGTTEYAREAGIIT